MKEKKIDGLTKMYGLFARNNGLKILCAHFKAHVQVRYLARSCTIHSDKGPLDDCPRYRPEHHKGR